MYWLHAFAREPYKEGKSPFNINNRGTKTLNMTVEDETPTIL